MTLRDLNENHLTKEEFCSTKSISLSKLNAFIKAGSIEFIKIGNRVFIDRNTELPPTPKKQNAHA